MGSDSFLPRDVFDLGAWCRELGSFRTFGLCPRLGGLLVMLTGREDSERDSELSCLEDIPDVAEVRAGL